MRLPLVNSGSRTCFRLARFDFAKFGSNSFHGKFCAGLGPKNTQLPHSFAGWVDGTGGSKIVLNQQMILTHPYPERKKI